MVQKEEQREKTSAVKPQISPLPDSFRAGELRDEQGRHEACIRHFGQNH